MSKAAANPELRQERHVPNPTPTQNSCCTNLNPSATRPTPSSTKSSRPPCKRLCLPLPSIFRHR